VKMDAAVERSPEPLPKVGNPTKARILLGWHPSVTFPELVRIMVEADLAELERTCA
jgi:GDPmannose 4,6-dehydratase